MPSPNPTDLEFYSEYNIDKIIDVKEGSFDAASATTVGALKRYAIVHDFPRPVFTDLLWSTDQVNWIDGGAGSAAGSFDSCISYSTIAFNYILTTKTTGTIYYKLISYWINDYDSNNPAVDGFSADNNDIFFDSRLNYQKIALEGTEVFTAAGAKIIDHNLGYKANFRVFFEAFPGEVWPINFGGAANPFLYDSANQIELVAFMKDNTLELEAYYPFVNTPTSTVWYKIYYDAGED